MELASTCGAIVQPAPWRRNITGRKKKNSATNDSGTPTRKPSGRNTSAHGPKSVVSGKPTRARRKSPATALSVWSHWKMPTYSSRYHLLTPRNGRRKFRSPVHSPSQVLLWTSRTPSPSSSRAHSRGTAVWHTVAWPRPDAATQAYPPHSSPYNVTWPRRLLARRRGGSSGARCGRPFFPRVLEHLVGLGFGIGQRPPGQPHPGFVLEAVPQLQQVLAAAAQFPGQAGGRRALGDAAGDQHQLAGAALGALEFGAGPGVVDAAAGGAAVVKDRVAVGAVDGPPPAAAVRAAEAAGVQGVHQEVVAGLFVQQVEQREVHGRGSGAAAGRRCSTPAAAGRKVLTTDLGP